MQIAVCAFGKLKTPGLRLAADYYAKLISPYATLAEVELKPLSVPDKSASTRRRVQRAESLMLQERLQRILGTNSAYFLLDETGEACTTRQWADLLQTLRMQSIAPVAFCLGSSLGFAETLQHNARAVLSFGPQTLPHELARVVLLEQLYRALSFLGGHPYHNEG